MKPVGRFIFYLLISLSVVFLLHTAALHFNHLPLFDNQIIKAYLVNYLLAVVIYTLLFFSRNKYPNYLGFFFMAGSFIKFLVFFIVFYPNYHFDGKIQIIEFAAFFVPYVICLIFETLGIIKIIKK